MAKVSDTKPRHGWFSRFTFGTVSLVLAGLLALSYVSINIVSSKHSRLLSRGLLYVADTRNKKKCVDIGNMGAYENALNLNVNDTRNTFLLELLTQNVEKDLTN